MSAFNHNRARLPCPGRLRAPIAALLALAGATLLAAPASAAPPRGFFGLQAWSTPSQGEFSRMSRGGAGTYRVNFLWSGVEPEPGVRNWGPLDEVVIRATRTRMTILPVILGSPRFAAASSRYPPRTAANASYRAFVREVVARYGPGTGFFRDHGLPDRPIRQWQVWNEPNLRFYWHDRPNAREYASFLRMTASEIRRVDRRARIVLAGLPEGVERNGNVSAARYLAQLYRVRGLARVFDAAAIHPYARDHRGIDGLVRRARDVMRRYRDSRTQLWITETGFASGGPRSPFTSSRAGQASRLRRTFSMLARNRRRLNIGRVVWFSWRDRRLEGGESDFWTFRTGLFERNGSAKPAWRDFARLAGGRPGSGRL